MKRLSAILLLAFLVIGTIHQVYATTCAQAVTIPATPTLPFISSLTCGTTNDITSANSPSCGNSSYKGGLEAVFVWTPANGYNDVTFAYSGVTYTGIFLYQGCPTSGGTCIGNYTSSGTSKTLAYIGSNMNSGTKISLAAGTTYYIVIDTWPTPNSPCPGTLTINGLIQVPCSGTPNPGNTLSTTTQACPSVNFTLSLQNATPGTGVSYVWQWSATESGPWTNFGGSAATQVTSQTTATWYRCEVNCSGNIGTSNPIYVNMGAWYICGAYCLPTYSSGGGSDNMPLVTLGSLSQSTSGNTTPYYYNYTATQNAIPALQRGVTVYLTITFGTDANQYNGVWIDFNQNIAFEASEFFTSGTKTTGAGPVTINILIPSDAQLGITRMRIRGGDDSQPTSAHACGASGSSYGQAHDYLVNIAPAPECPPVSALMADQIGETNANLRWTAGSNETSWEFAYGLKPFDTPAGAGTPTSSNTVNPLSGLESNTEYEFYVRANCGSNFSSWIGPVTFRTLCGAITTFPYLEGFEPGSVNQPCWKVIDGNGDGDAWNMNYNVNPYSGVECAMMYTDFNTANNDWLISPRLTLNGGQALKFWTRTYSAGEPDQLEVMLSTSGSEIVDFTETLMASTLINFTSYQQYIIDLSAYTGDVYIAFVRRLAPADGWRLYIDDVEVYNPSSLAGFVYDYDGNPVSGALIDKVGGASVLSGPGGEYLLKPLNAGEQQFKCSKTGYNPEIVSINIPLDASANYNFTLLAPQMAVDPASLFDILLPTESVNHNLIITNEGNGSLEWNAEVQFVSNLSPLDGPASSPLTYCAASGGCDEFISYFELGTIANESECSEYADYGSMSTDLAIGQAYSMTVHIGPPVYNGDYLKAWIDFDQNGVFDEPMITFPTVTGSIVTTSFTVPQTALPGPTTLRIRLDYNNALSNPCGTTQYGEVEDYTVNIVDYGWVKLDNYSGIVSPFGGTQIISATIDASKTPPVMSPGVTYTANVLFTSPSGIDPVTIPVTLTVTDGGLKGPEELTPFIVNPVTGEFMLKWKYFTLRDMEFDRFEVYSNGELVGTTKVSYLPVQLTEPSVYCYKVYAVYEGEVYSDPSNQACITYPLPEGVPLSDWALAVGALLIVAFTVFMIRRRS